VIVCLTTLMYLLCFKYQALWSIGIHTEISIRFPAVRSKAAVPVPGIVLLCILCPYPFFCAGMCGLSAAIGARPGCGAGM
jgi:hypothetical protein